MNKLDAVSGIQLERVKYIDYCAYFLGRVGRKDLQERFGIAPAAATRDFNLYNQEAPTNLVYQPSIRSYAISQSFSPLFDYTSLNVLSTITNELAGDAFTPEDSLRLGRTIEVALLSKFTRAIHLNKAIECTYRSTGSGESTKQLVPHALFDTGLHWYVRAYDRSEKRKQFADFSLSRFLQITELDVLPLPDEAKDNDNEYNTFVTLEVTPHPNQKHPQTIEFDYGMTGGVLEKEVRSSLAGFLLRRWNVDCSLNGRLSGYEYQLYLKNTSEIMNKADLFLAPGFKKSD